MLGFIVKLAGNKFNFLSFSMRFALLSFLCLGTAISSLVGCGDAGTNNNVNDSAVRKPAVQQQSAPEPLSDTQETADEKPFSLESFPKKWIQLTEIDGQKVIHNPCDAVNGAFTFRQTKGHGYVMNCDGGQDDVDYQILSYAAMGDSMLFTGKNVLSKKEIVFTVSRIDTLNHTAHWEWTDMDWAGSKMSIDMVTGKGSSKFKVVNEPPCLD